MEITATDVNDAYAKAVTAMRKIIATSEPKPSRAGDVYENLNPVVTRYSTPEFCVLWDAKRDANPFFHLMEALWMLAGRNDIAFLNRYSAAIAAFVDDGSGVQHGAYGHRWRQWFGFDQLDALVAHLQADPMSRRAVLQMWDPQGDLMSCGEVNSKTDLTELEWKPATGKDMPCNTTVYFSLRSGCLDMMVSNRSNDIILGCYGANAVHFSILLQYMANRLSVDVGTYTQVSFNWHTYTKTWRDKVEQADGPVWLPSQNHYDSGYAAVIKFDVGDAELLEILEFGHEEPLKAYDSSFVTLVVAPMMWAHTLWKRDRKEAVAYINSLCHPGLQAGRGVPDWLLAAKLWMERRVSC